MTTTTAQTSNLLGTTQLLSVGFKIAKSNASGKGVVTKIQYGAPAWESGYNMCAFASDACAKACLGHSSGRLQMPASKTARRRRTWLLQRDRKAYGVQIRKELGALERKARREELIAACRLNGATDTRYEAIKFDGMTIMESFPNIRFYDYTKWTSALRPQSSLPSNYHLTFSRSENTTLAQIQTELDAGRNVAVVFDVVPTTWEGWTVIAGDKDDLRCLDPVCVIVGLTAKGKAKKDTSGFVVRLEA